MKSPECSRSGRIIAVAVASRRSGVRKCLLSSLVEQQNVERAIASTGRRANPAEAVVTMSMKSPEHSRSGRIIAVAVAPRRSGVRI